MWTRRPTSQKVRHGHYQGGEQPNATFAVVSPVYSSTRPYSQTKSNTQRALMLPDEIMRMDNQESLVLLRGQNR
ncbi:MAG: type IV secretory system conjugative DNA transfer family protein [Hydrogeniiclostridium mannosilyticum]